MLGMLPDEETIKTKPVSRPQNDAMHSFSTFGLTPLDLFASRFIITDLTYKHLSKIDETMSYGTLGLSVVL